MELHHSKHHQTYVNSLNDALKKLSIAQANNDVQTQIQLQPLIKFHGGGHINHSLFWKNLAPPKSTEVDQTSAPKLLQAIIEAWGSSENFRERFNAALLGLQGSGWGWLVKFENENDRLRIVTTKDQDPIVGQGEVPIIGIDMWEHAYYLQVSRLYVCEENTKKVTVLEWKSRICGKHLVSH
jgi:Fe-Mn family superoxide dismutase